MFFPFYLGYYIIMIRPIVLVFILMSGVFALTHYLAVLGSLYYYYWWFDLPMHFWGGCLLTLGFHSFATLKTFKYETTYKLLLIFLLVVTLAWEIFEWQIGLGDIINPLREALKDMAVGFSGGLLTHLALYKYTIKP